MSERRTRLPAAERRRQIAEATLKILARRGGRELTAQRIAEEVGVKDGSLFRHFPSMEAMVAVAIDLFDERMTQSFPGAEQGPMDQLRSFFLHRAALVRRHPDVMRLAFSDTLVEVAGREGTQKVEQVVQRSLAFVRKCLQEGQRQGVVTREVPVDVLVWATIGVLRGASGAMAPRKGGRAKSTPDAAWRGVEALVRVSDDTRTNGAQRPAGDKTIARDK